MNQLVTGMIVMAYLVATLFFLRFWADTRDRLFMMFAVAFGILGVQRVLLALTTQTYEDTTYLYVVRLLAFLVILAAIVDKNRSGKNQR